MFHANNSVTDFPSSFNNSFVPSTETFNNASWKTFKLPFGSLSLGLSAGTLLPMALFGLVTNSVTIAVIFRSPALIKSIFNHFLISLCFSDLLSALISPLLLYRRTWGFAQWQIPHFLCKVYWGGDLMTSIATSYHILVFCALRFVSIAKPHAITRVKVIHCQICISFIWFISFCCGTFTHGMWMKVLQLDRRTTTRNGEDCSLSYEWSSEFKNFSLYGNLVFFYVPLLGVIFFSIAITFLLCGRRSKRIKAHKRKPKANRKNNEAEIKQRTRENQAIVQLVLIVISYLIGYIPLTVFYIFARQIRSAISKWKYGMSAYICMRFSECLNPVFYNLGSNKLRTETTNLLRQWFGVKKKVGQLEQATTSNNHLAVVASNTHTTKI